MKRIAVIIASLLMVCALDATNAQTSKRGRAGGGGFDIGQVAPEIRGKDLDNKPMKLSEFRGKVVVLDFWGFW
ncbi:MAG: redoxin domain-containing protein [Verrucomicrobia bacterium]|nr:redoxin domain-containing protein [Verrucomicrobiota bacterium]